MGNTASTERRRSPSRRKSLLLSAYALVAYSGISAASQTADGQHIQHVHTLSKTDSTEERIKLSSYIQMVKEAVKRAAKQSKQVSNPFHEQIERAVSFLAKLPNDEQAAVHAQDAHRAFDKEIRKVFKNIIRSSTGTEDQVQAQPLGKLVYQIVFYKTHPAEPLSPIFIPGTREFENHSLDNQRRSVVLRLESLLLDYWKETPLSEDDLNAILKVDFKRNDFFDDPRLLSYIDYLKRNTAWQMHSPIRFLLNKLREQGPTEFQIATRLLQVGADKKKGSLAYELLEALENDWFRSPLNPKQLLLELVPSLREEDLLNGPLKLWIQTFLKNNDKEVYQTIVHTLLERRDVKRGHTQLNSDNEPILSDDLAVSALEDNVMSLVAVIAKDWAKRFPLPSSTINLPSPHASPLFDALRIYFWTNKVHVGDLLLLHLKKMDKKALPREFERVYKMLQMKPFDFRWLSESSEMEISEMVALMVDIDNDRYEILSRYLFRQWVKRNLTKKDVFNLLKLNTPSTTLFQNRLFTVWYKYTTDNNVQPFEQIMSMREFLDHVYINKQFQSDLEEAVRTSDGQQQRALFDLLAIPWIKSGKHVHYTSFFTHSNSLHMKDWYKDLPMPPPRIPNIVFQ